MLDNHLARQGQFLGISIDIEMPTYLSHFMGLRVTTGNYRNMTVDPHLQQLMFFVLKKSDRILINIFTF
jgi:hypothetical protein